MNASAVAIGAAILAAIIAIVVPWMTFRLAPRQDHQRWLREQRSALYVDLLAEAHAEARYITHASVTPEVGARGSIFGSQAINGLFNKLQTVGSQATIGQASDVSTAVNLQVGELLDKLQDAVRHELGADRIGL